MANMTYCRFQNTLTDLRDCYDNIWDGVSKDEARARKRMIAICREIANEFPDDASVDDLPTEED